MRPHHPVPPGTCPKHANAIMALRTSGRPTKPNGGEMDLFAYAARLSERPAPEVSGAFDPRNFTIPPIADAQRLFDMVRAGAMVVFNHSGGKDSQAALAATMTAVRAAGLPTQRFVVLHADLSEVEWEGAQEHAAQDAARWGLPLVVVKAKAGKATAKLLGVPVGSPKSLLAMVRSRHRKRPDAPAWPTPDVRQCTSDLKAGPLQSGMIAYAKQHGYKLIVSVEGLRAAESTGRANRPIWHRDADLSKAGREGWTYLPIHGFTQPQVFQTIAAVGARPHEAYARGNERFSCAFCIMGSQGDIQRGAVHRPELYQEYLDVQRETGKSFQMKRVKGELVPVPLETIVGFSPEEARAKKRLLPVVTQADYDRLLTREDKPRRGCEEGGACPSATKRRSR